jgi:hypothetical protein
MFLGFFEWNLTKAGSKDWLGNKKEYIGKFEKITDLIERKKELRIR